MLARSESRDGCRVRVLALHTTEGIMRAADLKAWKSWAGSSHASADETGALLTPDDGFVPYSLASWTLRSGNAWSENIELCGFAKWKRGDWLARPKLLDAAARWLADRSKARGIPLVKLSPKELAAGKSGVIGHHDYTVGYSDGTHWDPGPGFPYDVVLAKAAAYVAGSPTPTEEDFLSALTDAEQRRLLEWADKGLYMLPVMKEQTDMIPAAAVAVGEIRWGVLDEQQGLRVSLSALFAKIAASDAASGVTAADIAALIPQGLASEVADELQRRLSA